MASEGLGDDFLEQILAVPSSANYPISPPPHPMALHLGMPLGLNLEQAFLPQDDPTNHHLHLHLHNSTTTSASPLSDRESVQRTPGLFSPFGPLHLRPTTLPSPPPPPSQLPNRQPFRSQPQNPGPAATGPQPPAIRPRVRARRGQATDPHSIAERLRRERIADRMKALQELVPSANKTDRAAMLDEIVDYVKFLRLQVKGLGPGMRPDLDHSYTHTYPHVQVLSMSRLGGAGAVAQLVADVPLSAVERAGERGEDGGNQAAWEKWSNDGTEQEVAKLMEQDVGAAMQFLQSKALCIMPISLASAIFRTSHSDASTLTKPEPNSHS